MSIAPFVSLCNLSFSVLRHTSKHLIKGKWRCVMFFMRLIEWRIAWPTLAMINKVLVQNGSKMFLKMFIVASEAWNIWLNLQVYEIASRVKAKEPHSSSRKLKTLPKNPDHKKKKKRNVHSLIRDDFMKVAWSKEFLGFFFFPFSVVGFVAPIQKKKNSFYY